MRKLIPAGPFPWEWWGCSECTYKTRSPRVGPFGRRTPPALGAQLSMAFDKHQCSNYS